MVLERTATWLDGSPFLLYAGLFLVYLLFALHSIASRPLWFDELFTFHIAQAPTLHQLFEELHYLDLNPPLIYLLTRASIHLFGDGALGTRLPDALAFFAAMVFVGRLVARRLGNLYGFAASVMLLASPTGDLFTEARPYALTMATLSLGWWMVEESAERPAGWRYALLFFAGCATVMSHVLAVPAWILLVAVVLVFPEWRRTPIVFAAAGPLLLLPWLRTSIAQHGHLLFPQSFVPTVTMEFAFYNARIVRECILLGLTAVVLLLLVGFPALRAETGWRLRRPSWAVALLWMAYPGLLMAWFMVTHAAFFYRYGSLASLGVAVVATALLAHWTSGRRSAALVVSVLALLMSKALPIAALQLAHPGRLVQTEPVVQPCTPCQTAARMHLPLVVANGLTFIEMPHRESSATMADTYYLQDLNAAHTIAHASIFDEITTVQRVFGLSGHVVDAEAFEQAHPRFLVTGTFSYPEQWLLRKLVADGARVQLLQERTEGYADHDLYLVETR